MQITSALAGFSLGKADILRRAMGKKKAKVLESQRADFVKGAKELHQVPEKVSEEIFDLLLKFAGYGFNKSHSVAYALVAYQTAYLKAHYLSQFMAAFLNSVLSDGDKVSRYIAVCREAGLKILPPDINNSSQGFTVDGQGAIRFGLAGIKSVGDNAVLEIMAARQKDGDFTSLMDFCKRVSMRVVNRRVMENLIKCGAMNSFGAKRSQLLAVLDATVDRAAAYQRDNEAGQMNLFGEENGFEALDDIPLPDLPEIPTAVNLANEKELIGFYVTGHPLDAHRSLLASYTPLYKLQEEGGPQDGAFVKVAGIISGCTIKNTKKGDSMAIVNLEDFSGRFPVIIFPKAYHESLQDVRDDNVVVVEGRLSIDERESKIIASRISRLQQVAPRTGSRTGLYLKVEAYLDNAMTQRRLVETLKKHSGSTAVYIYYPDRKALFEAPRDCWVELASPGLQEDLERILGAGNVKQK